MAPPTDRRSLLDHQCEKNHANCVYPPGGTHCHCHYCVRDCYWATARAGGSDLFKLPRAGSPAAKPYLRMVQCRGALRLPPVVISPLVPADC